MLEVFCALRGLQIIRPCDSIDSDTCKAIFDVCTESLMKDEDDCFFEMGGEERLCTFDV